MDNLPAHKVKGVRQAIEAAGATLLYLPAYSPDFNPIEMAFTKLKALLRAAAARTMTICGRLSVSPSAPSHHASAKIISPELDMTQRDRKML
jgi:transposase